MRFEANRSQTLEPITAVQEELEKAQIVIDVQKKWQSSE
jgi:hypothetical protein